jgi:xanthine dehydrogenase accessory factor
MAFTAAVFDGRAELAGITAVRVADRQGLEHALSEQRVVPVLLGDFAATLAIFAPDVLVDARMRKRSQPEIQRGLAALTIGLGPNFVAGETVDVAVETSWEALGQVIHDGATRPLSGEPRAIVGHARDRYRYAPHSGIFRTTSAIGDLVTAGQALAFVGATPLTAPLSGVLRGLTHDGVHVTTGIKIIEIDPRGSDALVRGIGERPARIAEGVSRAVTAWADSRSRRQ